jgi:predicted RNase H-like nuclease (RuvC/YqgF family)
MKDVTGLLMRVIAHENKYIDSMRHSLKEDELTILRLQNKSRGLEKEIEERKQIIEEYRGYLKNISEVDYTSMKSISSTKRQIDMKSSTAQIKFMTNLERQT